VSIADAGGVGLGDAADVADDGALGGRGFSRDMKPAISMGL